MQTVPLELVEVPVSSLTFVVVVMATSVAAAQTKTENRHLQTNRRQLKNGRGDIFTKTNES